MMPTKRVSVDELKNPDRFIELIEAAEGPVLVADGDNALFVAIPIEVFNVLSEFLPKEEPCQK